MRVIKVNGALFDVFHGVGFEDHSRVLIGRSYVQYVSGRRMTSSEVKKLINGINHKAHYQNVKI